MHSASRLYLRTLSDTLSIKMRRRLRTAQHLPSIEGTERLEQRLIDKARTTRVAMQAVHKMPPVLN